MKTAFLLFSLFFALLLLTATSSPALDCSGLEIRPGLDKETVIDACGDPVLTEYWWDHRYGMFNYYYGYGTYRPRLMEKLTYNLGKSYFMQVLTFADGFLVRVERSNKYGF
jgi:hypothetical protein